MELSNPAELPQYEPFRLSPFSLSFRFKPGYAVPESIQAEVFYGVTEMISKNDIQVNIDGRLVTILLTEEQVHPLPNIVELYVIWDDERYLVSTLKPTMDGGTEESGPTTVEFIEIAITGETRTSLLAAARSEAARDEVEFLLGGLAGIAPVYNSKLITEHAATTSSAITGTYFGKAHQNFTYRNGFPSNATDTAFVTCNYKSNPKAPFGIEFILDADEFEVFYKGNGSFFRILCDGQVALQKFTTPNDGSAHFKKLTFKAGKSQRTIKIESGNGFLFGGIKLKNTDTFKMINWKPFPRPFEIFGDDSVDPIGIDPWNSWGHLVGNILGRDVALMGARGTGYVSNGGSGKFKYLDRLSVDLDAETRSLGPVLFCGGMNDVMVDKAIFEANVQASFNNFQLRQSDVREIAVLDIIRYSDVESPALDYLSQILQKQAYQFSYPFLSTKSWITGNGNVGSPNGSGNSDIYVAADGNSFTAAGHRYIAQRFATQWQLLTAQSDESNDFPSVARTSTLESRRSARRAMLNIT